MFTMILLIYLQSGLTVNLAGAIVSGEFNNLATCQKAAVRKRGALPIPRGYDAAWQDSMCIPRLDERQRLRRRPHIAVLGAERG